MENCIYKKERTKGLGIMGLGEKQERLQNNKKKYCKGCYGIPCQFFQRENKEQGRKAG